jgi:hypothetical protein
LRTFGGWPRAPWGLMGHAAHETEDDAMTDTPPSTRRFSQIHLSTLLLASLAAGSILSMNHIPNRSYLWRTDWGGSSIYDETELLAAFKELPMEVSQQPEQWIRLRETKVSFGWPYPYRSDSVELSEKNLSLAEWYGPQQFWMNVGIGATIVVILMILCECLIRRRSRP